MYNNYNIYICVYCFLAELGSNQQYFLMFFSNSTAFWRVDRSTEIQQRKLSTLSKVLTTEWSLVSCRCQWSTCFWSRSVDENTHEWNPQICVMCIALDLNAHRKSKMTSTFLWRLQVSLESVKLLAIAEMQGSIICSFHSTSFPTYFHPNFRRRFWKKIKMFAYMFPLPFGWPRIYHYKKNLVDIHTTIQIRHFRSDSMNGTWDSSTLN